MVRDGAITERFASAGDCPGRTSGISGGDSGVRIFTIGVHSSTPVIRPPTTLILDQTCIAACDTCIRECLALVSPVAIPGDVASSIRLKRLLDCAHICQVTVDFIKRSSAWQTELCALCGDVCDACAAILLRADPDSSCGAACRDCAEACRNVLADNGDPGYTNERFSDERKSVEAAIGTDVPVRAAIERVPDDFHLSRHAASSAQCSVEPERRLPAADATPRTY